MRKTMYGTPTNDLTDGRPTVIYGQGEFRRTHLLVKLHSAPKTVIDRRVEVILNDKEVADLALTLLYSLPLVGVAGNKELNAKLDKFRRLTEL